LITSTQLPNGIRILLEPVPATEIISVGFWFLHGSRDEAEDREGYSHFLEHMLFKGTSRRSTTQIAREIDRVGGGINAFTEKEVTCVYCTVPKEHFHLAVDILTDIVFHSTFPEHELDLEKTVVINELKSSEDTPEEKSFDLFFSGMWDGHPLSRRIIGTERSIKGITREALLNFYRRFFTAANLVVSVAGDFTEQEVLEEFARIECPAGADDSIKNRIKPVQQVRADFVPDKFQQAHVYLGSYLRPARSVRDYYIQLIVSTCFGEAVSSRLFQEIREKQGLCYSIFSSRIYYSDVGLWIIYANTLPGMIPRLLDSTAAEYRRFIAAPPAQDELEESRCHIRGTLILSKQDLEVRMKRIARQYIVMRELLTYEESMSLVGSITKDEIDAELAYLDQHAAYNLLVFGCRDVVKYRKYTLSMRGKE
jgi:predicted Zn-dependent peptidase